MIEETPVQVDKNTPITEVNQQQAGFIPMMLALLALVIFVIVFVYLRVLKVHH